MTSTLTIRGYETDCSCDHCGRSLAHGIQTDTMGVIGADCFVKMVAPNKKHFSGTGKPTASIIRERARMIARDKLENLRRFGYNASHFTFERT